MTYPDRTSGIDDRWISHPGIRRALGAGAAMLIPGEPVEGGRLSRETVDGLPGDIEELRAV